MVRQPLEASQRLLRHQPSDRQTETNLQHPKHRETAATLTVALLTAVELRHPMAKLVAVQAWLAIWQIF